MFAGGVDYVTLSQVLTFGPLNQEQNVTLTIIDDNIVDNFETFSILLTLATDLGNIVISPDTTIIRIQDADRREWLLCAVEPTNTVEHTGTVKNLEVGTSHFILYREVVLSLEVKMY